MPPKILYSSATVLVLMFFKLNSLSALIFYFNDSKLETRQGKENLSIIQLKYSLCFGCLVLFLAYVYRIHAAVGIVGKPCFAIAHRGTFRL